MTIQLTVSEERAKRIDEYFLLCPDNYAWNLYLKDILPYELNGETRYRITFETVDPSWRPTDLFHLGFFVSQMTKR